MSVKIIPLDSFKQDFKKLQKKYKNIKSDIKKLILELEENPKCGISLQDNCFKVRVANSSIPTGKRGGFRTIYYFLDKNNIIYLISIYSKTQRENISDIELSKLLKINNIT